MGFQFPLASVQRLRELVEEREERLLKDIQLEIGRARASVSQIDIEVASINQARHAGAKSSSEALDIHAAYAHLETLKLQRAELEERIAKLDDLRQRQMKVYQDAHQAREMLDNLHDEQRTSYEIAMDKREQRTLDDTFGAQRARRQAQ